MKGFIFAGVLLLLIGAGLADSTTILPAFFCMGVGCILLAGAKICGKLDY